MEFHQTEWKEETYKELICCLKEQGDEAYREFHGRLIRDRESMIGVRTPVLKKLAREIAKGEVRHFLACSEYSYQKGIVYYESILLEGLVIGNIREKDISSPEEVISYMDQYAAKIRNWAQCDLFCSGMKYIRKEKEAFLPKILTYTDSEHEFICRLGIVLLLDYYLEDVYLDRIFRICDRIQTDAYYVNMAIAWLISVAYVRFEEKTMAYLRENRLSVFTYKKALQKITESHHVCDEKKKVIRSLKKNRAL